MFKKHGFCADTQQITCPLRMSCTRWHTAHARFSKTLVFTVRVFYLVQPVECQHTYYTFIYSYHTFIYSYIHIYIYAYTRTYIQIYINTYIHIYIYTYIHINVYAYIRIHVHINIYIWYPPSNTPLKLENTVIYSVFLDFGHFFRE